MTTPLRIDRNRSSLGNGTIFGRRKRGVRRWQLIAWVIAVGTLIYIYFNAQALQPLVMTALGQAPTATPENNVYAQRGYADYLNGNLESAINNYCRASHGIPNAPFSVPRCKPPDQTNPPDPALLQVDPNIVYELVRMLAYRSYDDRRLDTYNADAEKWGKLFTDLDPNNSRLHAIYAFALVNNNKSEQAVPEALNAVSLDQSNGDAHAYLSMAYYSGNRYQDALTEAANALKLSPNSIDTHIAEAQAFEITSQWTSAEDEFIKATQINPRLEFPYFYLGAFYVYRNQQQTAIKAYDQVLAMDNKSVKAYTRKCATFFNIGDTQNALSSCKNATGLDPNYTEAWKWQGQVLYNQRDYEDALTAFDTCRKQDNDAVAKNEILTADRLPECWYLGGLTQYFLGHCDKAYPLFNEVLDFTSNSQAIKLTRKGIDGCSAKNPNIPTPTLIPTATLPPAPIN